MNNIGNTSFPSEVPSASSAQEGFSQQRNTSYDRRYETRATSRWHSRDLLTRAEEDQVDLRNNGNILCDYDQLSEQYLLSYEKNEKLLAPANRIPDLFGGLSMDIGAFYPFFQCSLMQSALSTSEERYCSTVDKAYEALQKNSRMDGRRERLKDSVKDASICLEGVAFCRKNFS